MMRCDPREGKRKGRHENLKLDPCATLRHRFRTTLTITACAYITLVLVNNNTHLNI
jgi:hypothetical protein